MGRPQGLSQRLQVHAAAFRGLENPHAGQCCDHLPDVSDRASTKCVVVMADHLAGGSQL